MKECIVKTVVLMNTQEESKTLVNLLKKDSPEMEAIISDNLDHFIKTISTHKIDSFILDWNFKNYQITDLVEKIRKTNKYRKAPIAFVADKKDAKLPFMYSCLRTDMVITRPFVQEEIGPLFNKVIHKAEELVIPSGFEVLILDDNPAILEIMSDHMIELNHAKFQTSKCIVDAKKLIGEKDFDMFLIDWNLGDGTCLDLIEHIRSIKNRKRISDAFIMVITGRDDVDDIMTLLRYNVKDHIIKPFEYEELEEKLTYGLERHLKQKKIAG